MGAFSRRPGAHVEFRAARRNAAPAGCHRRVQQPPRPARRPGRWRAVRPTRAFSSAALRTRRCSAAFFSSAGTRPKSAPKGMRVLAALPVKTGSALLDAYFDAGFALCAMRGLFELRPHYIFAYAPDARAVPQAWIPAADTLALSRALAQGTAGIALRHGAADIQVGLCTSFKIAQNSRFCV